MKLDDDDNSSSKSNSAVRPKNLQLVINSVCKIHSSVAGKNQPFCVLEVNRMSYIPYIYICICLLKWMGILLIGNKVAIISFTFWKTK